MDRFLLKVTIDLEVCMIFNIKFDWVHELHCNVVAITHIWGF